MLDGGCDGNCVRHKSDQDDNSQSESDFPHAGYRALRWEVAQTGWVKACLGEPETQAHNLYFAVFRVAARI